MSDAWPPPVLAMTRIDPSSCTPSAWKQLGRGAQLGLVASLALGIGMVACTKPEDVTPIYAGSCPVLLECANKLGSTNAAELFASYGDPNDAAAPMQGSCWSSGLANHDRCRKSCVDALTSLNAEFANLGLSCGECETDGDCAPFGADATCKAGYCARAGLGSIELETTTDSGTSGVEDSAGKLDVVDDPEANPELDPACQVDSPRVVFDTSLGALTIEVDTLAEPGAAELFLAHVSANFYDDTLIHRVVDGALIEGGAFGLGFDPLLPLATVAATGEPALAHGDDSFALVRTQDRVGAAFYLIDPPGPAAPTGVPIGTLVAGAGVRDAIAAVEVFDFGWRGFLLHNVPLDDIVIHEAYCE